MSNINSMKKRLETFYKMHFDDKTKKIVERRTRLVMDETGWDHDYALAQMKKSKKELGISFREYQENGYYNYPIYQQKALHRRLVTEGISLKKRKKHWLKTVATVTGWNKEKAAEELEKAKKKGIPNKIYANLQLYKFPEDQHVKIFKDYNRQVKNEKKQKVNYYYKRIMDVTGWSEEKTHAVVAEAKKRTGCTVNNFFIYRFYELTPEQQHEVFLNCESKKIMKRYDNDRELCRIINNKALTNRRFPKLVKRHWCINIYTTREKFIDLFKDSGKIVYKPINGCMGAGVEAFAVNEDNINELYDKISKWPEGVVEEFVKQHPDMNRLIDTSVNTMRVVTVSSKDIPVTSDGKMFDIAYIALRMGNGTSVADNFHCGGLIAVVDKETGCICTNATDQYGNVFTEHPVTKTKIKGFKVPYFEEAVRTITEICTEEKLDGYMGWDVAISVNGPELLEVNNDPGIVALSSPYLAEGKSSRQVMEKYL